MGGGLPPPSGFRFFAGSTGFADNTDVDLIDFEAFLDCFTGPDGGPVPPECLWADLDGDLD